MELLYVGGTGGVNVFLYNDHNYIILFGVIVISLYYYLHILSKLYNSQL